MSLFIFLSLQIMKSRRKNKDLKFLSLSVIFLMKFGNVQKLKNHKSPNFLLQISFGFFWKRSRFGPGLPDSTVLSFTELHLAFQKVQYLLQDWTRDNARLWMLMNSERVANQFRVLILTDPVTIGTGHSYDQSSIMKWFRAGKPICPKTGEKMKNMEVVPNLALKRLIQQYCNENGIPFGDSGLRKRDIGRSTVAGSLAAEGAMKMVAEFVSGSVGTGSNKAAYEIRLLSKTSIFNRSCLVEAGVVPHLLKLLASADSETQENAVARLLNLSKHSKGKAVIVENGGVDLVVDVLKEGLKVEACQHAADTLFYLASIEEYRVLIGENPRAIPALRELIKNEICSSSGHDDHAQD